MVHNGGMDPTRPKEPMPKESKHLDNKELKQHAEHIHSTIGYAAKDPKSFEKTFLNIAILMHLEEKRILTNAEECQLIEDFRSVRDGMNDGSMRIPDVSLYLEKMVEDAKYRNPKARILALIIELEHLICINPPNNQEGKSLQELEGYMNPIIEDLKQNLSNIQMTMIHKEFEEELFYLKEKRGDVSLALKNLKQKCEEIFKRLH